MSRSKESSAAESAPSSASVSGRPVVIGEVLFDVFPDGSRVLGGAPFNVAWHLQAFGLRPVVITRVGDDAAGARVRDAMDRWGMATDGVQLDRHVETGEVEVTLEGGEPRFEIVPDRAWDRLDGDAALTAIEGACSVLYHGSLIARSDCSRKALRVIRDASGLPVFVDANLRDPWWTVAGVLELVDGARWVKLNHHELLRLVDESTFDPAGVEGVAADFSERMGLRQLIVTLGADGAVVRSGDGTISGKPPGRVRVVDTVGAGDAFSAVWILGLVRRWAPEVTLPRALGFAAEICGVRGATTDDRELYQRTMEGWGLSPGLFSGD